MEIRVLILIVLSLTGCARTEESSAPVSISNLRVGLMRETADGSWHIYSPGNRFPLKPNGQCEANGKSQECMWYGIEFDYSPASSRLVLQCTAAFNKRTDVFDPERESAPKADATSFEIPLEGSNGEMSMPAAVFRQPDDTPAPWTVEVTCGHDGKELLRYAFTALHEA